MGKEREDRGRRRGPRIAICGSSSLDRYPESLIEFIADQPADTAILLRAPSAKDPGRFEQVVAKVASGLWLTVDWFRPETGRGATFYRDIELVRSADLVLAYFSTLDIIGGTGHVVERAIDMDVPVYSYGLGDKGFMRIGEHDPHDAWGSVVP